MRELRTLGGYSQTEVATYVGVTQGSISNYEAGKRDIPMWVLLATIEQLDCSPSQFFDGVPELLVFDAPEATEATIAALELSSTFSTRYSRATEPPSRRIRAERRLR